MFIPLKVRLNLEGTTGDIRVQLSTEGGETGTFLVNPLMFTTIDDVYELVVLLRDREKKEAGKTTTPKRRKQISRKQEQKLAESLGGERHYGSGNKPGYKGDVRVRGKYRVECKYTSKKSRSISLAEIQKIRSECAMGEEPMINIQFREPGTLEVEEDWICVPRRAWEKLHAPTDDR